MTKRVALVLLALWIAGCSRQGDVGEGVGATPSDEVAVLKGTWSGSVLLGDVGVEVTVEFTADTVKISKKGLPALSHPYSVDPTKQPKWIDIKGPPRSDPPYPTTYGIYEVEGGQLKICMGNHGQRPTKFGGGRSVTGYYRLTRK